jgi:hypothetical protein
MLELIARFPIETQDEMLKEAAAGTCSTARRPPAELRYLDEQYLRVLKAAPWDLDDAKLVPKAGACSACPKRSSCQQQLFAEAKDDRCLDDLLEATKAAAHVDAASRPPSSPSTRRRWSSATPGLPPRSRSRRRAARTNTSTRRNQGAKGARARRLRERREGRHDRSGSKAKGYGSDASSSGATRQRRRRRSRRRRRRRSASPSS